jgi:hypothetical protein
MNKSLFYNINTNNPIFQAVYRRHPMEAVQLACSGQHSACHWSAMYSPSTAATTTGGD